MRRSVSYDRAADFYDATRALPRAVARKLTDALMAELAAAGAHHALEVGIGTGRISRPLAARGVRICGVDIAPRMLARLGEQLGPDHLSPDLVLGDATQLPVASGAFRAVLVFHLLHLVSSSEAAARELRRVLAPGGMLIRGVTSYLGENPWQVYVAKSNELLAKRNVVVRTRRSREQIRAALTATGGSSRVAPVAEDEERNTPEQNLDRIRQRIDSWTWGVPDDLFADFLAEFEPWYRQHYQEMEREYVQRVSYELEVWSF